MSFLTQPFNWELSYSDSIPNLLLQHLWITFVSVGLGLLIAFPIALLVARYAQFYTPTISVANIIYTLPSLVVMPLLIPLTGLNPPTIIIPLVAYSQVVLIRNIVAAIRGVDPALLDVGTAMGMNRWQLLSRVTLPQALPVIIAGVRIVTVTSIGIASLAPLIGVHDLGFYVFQGISFAYNDEIFGGAILITALALLMDAALLGVERWLSRGNSSRVARA
jgi:osmoprotectant transport system permease protein